MITSGFPATSSLTTERARERNKVVQVAIVVYAVVFVGIEGVESSGIRVGESADDLGV